MRVKKEDLEIVRGRCLRYTSVVSLFWMRGGRKKGGFR